ncbi:hypothetical protein, partial [Paraprevotella clara]|uniref:hypothetical protein n=1 Tax=Paraprevotella clara TaxID=454154 RepID=UPI0039F4D51E
LFEAKIEFSINSQFLTAYGRNTRHYAIVRDVMGYDSVWGNSHIVANFGTPSSAVLPMHKVVIYYGLPLITILPNGIS